MIRLELAGVKNPNTIEETESFTLRTKTPANKVIDTIKTGLTVINSEAASI